MRKKGANQIKLRAMLSLDNNNDFTLGIESQPSHFAALR